MVTTAVALELVGLAVVILALGRVFHLETVRRLRGPLSFMALAGIAQWGVLVFGGEDLFGMWTLSVLLLAVALLVARCVLILILEWLIVRRFAVQIPRLLRDVVALIVYVAVTAGVLKFTLSINVGTLLVSSAVITVVLGLALQETLGTLLSGLVLAWERRLESGTWIVIDGTIAQVEEQGWRSTVLRTLLDERLLVPNADLARSRVKVLGSGAGPVAASVRLGVTYKAAPHRVKEVLRRVAEGVPGVLLRPAPQLLTTEFGDSSVGYECRMWTMAPWNANYITDEFLTRAWSALARAGMEIPFPQRTVHIIPPAPPTDVAATCREALARCELFADLPADALDLLASSSAWQRYAPGEAVVRQGEASTAMYVIAAGQAEVVHGGERVATIPSGEVFGEFAFLMGEPRSATVRAGTELDVVEVNSTALRPLLSQRAEMAEELANRVASRRRELEEAEAAMSARSRRSFAAQLRERLLRLVGM
jgi:small-conductance mechanosensitive channel/CRP-like cAMP-binding protein